MFKTHTCCRACGLGKPELSTLKVSTAAGDAYAKPKSLVKVIDLGVQPLANDFVEAGSDQSGWAPLEVMVCPRCGLAQLSVVVDPAVLYRHYSYITSRSKTMYDHFNVIRDDIIGEATAVNSVLEIGSNDGTLLAILKNNPFETVLGCDPAENLAAIANKNGIPTFCGLFNSHDCDCQTKKDVVIARHVMCHIDDWRDFVLGLERVTHGESLVCIEVPYYKDMVEKGSWDQVYHEHLSYMNVTAMVRLLEHSAFHVHKINHYPIHNGSVMIFLRRNGSSVKPDPKVSDWVNNESGIMEEWKSLANRTETMVSEMKNLVYRLVSEGKTVVGYGASAKSTVWMNACKFRKKDIRWICDNTPQKMYKMSPGSDVPIVDDGALTRDLPDYAICFAHNFFKEIREKESIFSSKGGQWILPAPSPVIVT